MFGMRFVINAALLAATASANNSDPCENFRAEGDPRSAKYLFFGENHVRRQETESCLRHHIRLSNLDGFKPAIALERPIGVPLESGDDWDKFCNEHKKNITGCAGVDNPELQQQMSSLFFMHRKQLVVKFGFYEYYKINTAAHLDSLIATRPDSFLNYLGLALRQDTRLDPKIQVNYLLDEIAALRSQDKTYEEVLAVLFSELTSAFGAEHIAGKNYADLDFEEVFTKGSQDLQMRRSKEMYHGALSMGKSAARVFAVMGRDHNDRLPRHFMYVDGKPALAIFSMKDFPAEVCDSAASEALAITKS